jgi:Mrp family chromosome partitioning ATPase
VRTFGDHVPFVRPRALLASLLDRFGRGLRSGRQVGRVLGLPTLGLVPRAGELAGGEEPHRYLAARPLSAYAEAVRAIHTSLQLSNVDSPPKVVLVASSLPREGRTTLAASLAAFAAREGSRRVLLLDLDLGRPGVGRELTRASRAGLLGYVAGELTLGDAVGRDEEAGLDHLRAEPEPQAASPAEPLDGRTMRQLLSELRAAYDYVVIDSAPLLPVGADAAVAPPPADAALFVARWETTGREAAVDGLARLRGAGASVAGAVLTQVDVARHARYGYGDLDEYYGKYATYHAS